jgi:hypothetical protein
METKRFNWQHCRAVLAGHEPEQPLNGREFTVVVNALSQRGMPVGDIADRLRVPADQVAAARRDLYQARLRSIRDAWCDPETRLDRAIDAAN